MFEAAARRHFYCQLVHRYQEVRVDNVTDISSLREICADVTDQCQIWGDTYILVPGPRENPGARRGPACSIGEFVSCQLTLSLGVSFAQNGCGSQNERQEENAEVLPTDQ